MKKIKYISTNHILMMMLAFTLVFTASCKEDNDSAAPAISEIRNYAAAPNDTVVRSVNPGQWIVLQGSNLSGVSKVTFCGVPATIKSALFTDNNLVVEIPEIAYNKVKPADLNVIEATNANGTAVFKIDIIGKPLIMRVRNYSDASNDTILKSVLPGQKINIVGYNLKNPINIAFQGVPADLKTVSVTDSSTILQVPTDLSGGNASLTDMISYTTAIGTGNYSIKVYGPPVVLTISYEIPHEGDIVYLYGSNLTNVEKITFAGADIKKFEELDGGTTIKFVAPALTQAGPVVITSPGGTFTSLFNVNDIISGRITDFEWGDTFKWEWWGGASLGTGDSSSSWPTYYPEFAKSTGIYMVMDFGVQASGDGNSNSTALRIKTSQWVPEDKMSDPISSWVLKFEMSITKEWNGSTLCIMSGNDSYMYRYEPWQITSTKTQAYKTDGWQTVTIPLSEFRIKDATLGDGRAHRHRRLPGSWEQVATAHCDYICTITVLPPQRQDFMALLITSE